ncbi:MAG: hypothetical protein JNN06_11755 [Gemmobacter sp.]|uniref:hypothetical protein n=1 Tax=Gemmobacter sp. TaxID=1898957 RepID=UPI001A593632|nr:hypothetical protein [Gemmobacter sp.]MBL8562943.1 hypothetical protein [Gemmobacter sp.]
MYITPNPIAWLVLLSWPLVTYLFFRKMTPDRALIWTVLGAYMLLPPLLKIDLPVVPDVTKDSLPGLMGVVMVLFVLRDRLSLIPQSWIGRGLLVVFVLSPFATVLTNGEVIPKGPREVIQGMRIYDSLAAVINQGIEILPFFLARRYLATEEAMRNLLLALVTAGLIYSVPMVIETQLSPQMNVWIYGYFQHDFWQTVRAGGYRPIVFMPHGLWVAFFAFMAALAAATVFKVGPALRRPKQGAVTLYLLAMVAACKSMGAILYSAVLIPVMLMAPRRWQVLLASAVAVLVMTYPILRGAHLIPMQEITEFAGKFSADRAASFQFRVDNEELLLAHAERKILFGWGGYGRNMVYDEFTGRSNIADGMWIITMGIYGWTGYIAQFGLLVLPLLLLGREVWSQRSPVSPWVASVSLIFAANLLDLLPNGTLIPFTWLMAGALLGQAEALARQRKLDRAADIAAQWHPKAGRTVI